MLSKSKYDNKVLKTVVGHRTQFVNGGKEIHSDKINYRCVRNHRGSFKLMEETSGNQSKKEMVSQKWKLLGRTETKLCYQE